MKARVKVTREIVYANMENECYKAYEIDIVSEVTQPDYWEKLKHQAAIVAMQGILSNTKLMDILGMQKGRELDEMVADLSLKHATALVNKLKEEKK